MISSIVCIVALCSAAIALYSLRVSRRALAANVKNFEASHWRVDVINPVIKFMKPSHFSVSAINSGRAEVQITSAFLQIPGSDRIFFAPDEELPLALKGGHRQRLTFTYDFVEGLATVDGLLRVDLGDGRTMSHKVTVAKPKATASSGRQLSAKRRLKKATALFGPPISEEQLRAYGSKYADMNPDGSLTYVNKNEESNGEKPAAEESGPAGGQPAV
ncbi:hypothetical protein ACIRBY_38160 [Streptomyces sp. NPDC096136]|uniref:hypothetical protein n=1 Tax=Streptomyces sp. NPDC096136 TaxID=3366076 RepID=UPI0038223D05